MAVIASLLSGLRGTSRPACSRVGAFQVRIHRPNTSACARLPIHLVAHILRHIVHLILPTSVLSCAPVADRWMFTWYLFITLQISFHRPAMGERQRLAEVRQLLHNSTATDCIPETIFQATRYGRHEIKAIKEGPHLDN